MIYLTTGANGAGKTLFTLKDVRELSLKDNRPVYYNGRFELTADFGWTKIDIKDWQTVPDGAIFLVDEAQNDFPTRSPRDPVPPYVMALAEHRRRGFDFFLITQHPNLIDSFIRKLIGSPGWHRHLKRASGAPLVSILTWPAVNQTCEKHGSGSSAQIKTAAFPKEVYSWYASTSLDTSKVKVPFQLKVFIVAIILVPILVYFGWSTFRTGVIKSTSAQATTAVASVASVGSGSVVSSLAAPVTVAELANSYVPRFPGFPATAPRYDALTAPVVVPVPAACIKMGTRCQCYSQQATRLDVPIDVCTQIVERGYFQDFKLGDEKPAPDATSSSSSSSSPSSSPSSSSSSSSSSYSPKIITADLHF
mgnify:CR=1 FL=1